ncbi:MAG TPA: enolase C-terminal domain-like protein [Thermoplasmataceae archaeon]|nr:enolase [Thermoplasmatales archaeon AK]HLH86308.1 enolase C-terminal domain-like protein [Thermoplasmataceae archaeon]
MEPHIPIRDIKFQKVLDSRGNLSVEATVILDGASGRCSAPAGASTGETEVLAYPSGGIDAGISYFRKNVRNKLIGFNAIDQNGLDRLIREADGTDNLSSLGGNLSTAISVANARAVSDYLGIPLYRYVGGTILGRLPHPIGNVLGGGKHSVNGTTIQEFLVSAQGSTFMESALTNILVHRRIGKILSELNPGISIGVGDERAWTVSMDDMKAVEVLERAVSEISSETKVPILMGCDFAASSFFEGGKYVYRNVTRTRDEQIDFAVSLATDHKFYYIEDPMDERDFEGHAEITSRIRHIALVVGDDLYTTNPERIKKGIALGSTNGVLIKVNQIGSLSRTQEAVNIATENSMRNVISHRSGETTDDFIAHLGVAFRSEFIKTGTIGGERVAKLNELIRIEAELSEN